MLLKEILNALEDLMMKNILRIDSFHIGYFAFNTSGRTGEGNSITFA